jgi:hypothetical protein
MDSLDKEEAFSKASANREANKTGIISNQHPYLKYSSNRRPKAFEKVNAIEALDRATRVTAHLQDQ